MTSRELPRAPPDTLSPPDRRRHALAVESCPVACPASRTPVDAITAAGRELDEYTFGPTTPTYRCPHCGAVLDRVTPPVAFGPSRHRVLNHERPGGGTGRGSTMPGTPAGDPGGATLLSPRRTYGPQGPAQAARPGRQAG